jgi:TRAP-type mannitol/chloroaromatic compound transport system permease small subunit
MKNLIRLIDTLNESLGRWISWLALAMVLVMGLIVVLRYAFQVGSIALQESVMYLNALIFTFGAAYTLKQQGHVRVDVFYNRLSLRAVD